MSDQHPDGVAQDTPPHSQSQVFAEHACKALAEAQASPLPNVRARFVIAARRWIALAQQARKMELRHAAADQPASDGEEGDGQL